MPAHKCARFPQTRAGHPPSFLPTLYQKPCSGDLGIFSDLTVVNVLARVVMKNVANCDIQYELRSFGNY